MMLAAEKALRLGRNSIPIELSQPPRARGAPPQIRCLIRCTVLLRL